jgi:hypothetical protein
LRLFSHHVLSGFVCHCGISRCTNCFRHVIPLLG